MSNALTPIVARARAEVRQRSVRMPLAELESLAAERLAADPPRPFAAALAAPGLSVIAEHKRRSPSAGPIREDLELEDVVAAYERGGARAVSVLTETGSFGGSLEDLRRARRAASLPILRKDFIVEPYQVTESAAAGADAILLIVAALDGARLAELYGQATGLGLGVLLEVHDGAELKVAVPLRPEVIGINNRDLTTLRVDPERTFTMLREMPEGTTVVSESGWRSREHLDRLRAAGVDAVLIGEALMRSADIEAVCHELTRS